jgi:hypothetical protein
VELENMLGHYFPCSLIIEELRFVKELDGSGFASRTKH